ncbi:MAG TPA: MASE1 domain-containing protein [Steroidobacteraceae bacterium]|jgi:signal transduction histidine kinase|nr:MASE1 domain-containing protein [Steroidobacteraceae bacterium]
MLPAAPDEDRRPGVQQGFKDLGVAQRVGLFAALVLVYSLLVLLGLSLREKPEHLTIIWPAAGLLFMVLWRSPRRLWIWIVAMQLTVELTVNAFHSDQFTIAEYAPYALANSLDGMVGALVASRLMPEPAFPSIQNVLRFIAAVAIGAAVSAVLGAFASTHTLGGARYLREWQLWWDGNWLGSLCIAPVLMGWLLRWRARELSAPAPPPLELLLIGGALLAMTIWVFSAPPNRISTILDMPFSIMALIVVAAFRFPPRWSTLLAAAVAVLASYYASRHLGPFAGDPNPFVRVGTSQLNIAAIVLINFMLSVVLFEMRNAFLQLRTSGERYRNFIEQSSEAVWRIELAIPMDPGLPVADQIAWLQAHAYVAESNLSYLRLNRQLGLPEMEARQWRPDVPWSATFIEHLGAASQRGYSMDGQQFSVASGSRQMTYITGFRGVIEAGKLVRVWGVARDVTELVELNDRLRQQQDRLRLYARELVGAEERARRATAVDLHDGIGQQLVGLAMTLDAVAARSPPELRLLLGEATHTVREVQSIAQRVIADLSPPGLYELGLEPALKWLMIYMRSKDNFRVDLQVPADDPAIDLDLRVLVFKVIRELLRNVVKHSGAQAAKVTVSHTPQELRVVVEDQGVGFEWQLSLFETRAHGFGLWSVADRVREAAGEMTVDTGPGRGCRVTVVFPLGGTKSATQQRDSRSQSGDSGRGRFGTS